MTASLFPQIIFQPLGADGLTMPGGKLYTYAAGTTLPLTTFTDDTGTVANSNPVILDSYGVAHIYLGSLPYKFNLTGVDDVQHPQFPIDNITSTESIATSALDISNSNTGLIATNTADIAAIQAQLAALTNTAIPTGTISAYSAPTAPTGYLLCDGVAVSRTSFAALFAIVGTRYGVGNGSTTFNLPNLAGRVIIGVSTSPSHALATTGGEEAHTLTAAEAGSYAHTHAIAADDAVDYVSGPKVVAGYPIAAVGLRGGADHDEAYELKKSLLAATLGITGPSATVGAAGHNNMQPYLTLTYVIKT